jgi:hypothetical protein
MSIRDAILRSYTEACKALDNYLDATKHFTGVYDSILEGLRQKYNNSMLCDKWHATELLQFNSNRTMSALLVANFYGDEVFASLALLLCLEVCELFKFKLFAIPIASKTVRKRTDSGFKRALIRFSEERRIDLFILLSQGHPYLDGFYVEVPSKGNRSDKSDSIIRQVAKHHEVGAFSASLDKPTYAIIRAGSDELISKIREKNIEAYRFVISQDIWAGYRAAMVLLDGHSAHDV